MLLPSAVHPSWASLITSSVVVALEEIEKQIGNRFNPGDQAKVLKFLSTDLDRVRVIWLGQDVYPAEGAATGRSFEVGGLQRWSDPFRQVSLKNIVRLIHKEYSGVTEYGNIKKFSVIQQEIKAGRFAIKPPNEWFDALEAQGVLFLNTSFTCEIGKPNSHQEIWQLFSRQVLQYIAMKHPDMNWFLWGKEAIAQKMNIPHGVFHESRHPMMCSEKYVDDFLKFTGFRRTMSFINWLG